MKKILWFLGIYLFLWVVSYAQIPVGNRLPLIKATHINNTFSHWDTVYAVIFDSSGVIVTTRPLSSGGTGIWTGYYQTSVIGSFVAQYRAVYSGDTVAEESYFTVKDTNDQKVYHYVGTATDPANMATTLFGGQQYIADNMGGGGVSSCGAGAFACTVSVRDTTTILGGINLVHVFIKGSDGATAVIDGWTDADGKRIFYLDSLGSGLQHKTWLVLPTYSFDNPDSIDLRYSTTFTFYGTAYSPTAPVAESVCVVYGYIFNSDGSPCVGARVEMNMDKSGVSYHGDLINVSTVRTVYTDGNGRYEFSTGFYPNDLLLPPNTKWHIKAYYGGKFQDKLISVPIADSYKVDFP